MRKIREALDLLNLPSDSLLLHGNQRVVYGVQLARNFRDVLLGLADRPAYLLSTTQPKAATQRLATFWRRRWLAGRVSRPGILAAVAAQSLAYPVSHAARVPSAHDEVSVNDQPLLVSDWRSD
jgi:hypothetical protein